MGKSQRTPGKTHSFLYWEKNKHMEMLNKRTAFEHVDIKKDNVDKTYEASQHIHDALRKYRLQQQLIRQLSLDIKEHVNHLHNNLSTENTDSPENPKLDGKPMNPTFDRKPKNPAFDRKPVTFLDGVQKERQETLNRICDKHPELSNDSRYIRMDYILSDKDNRLLYAMVPKVINISWSITT